MSEARRAALGLLGAALGQALSFVGTLAGASFLMLWLVSQAEGDAADLLMSDALQRGRLVAALQLDLGVVERWVLFWRGLMDGDLGVSWTYRPGQPVLSLLTQACAASAPLLLGALALNMGLGLMAAAPRGLPGRVLRRNLSLVSVTPAFLLGWAFILTLNRVAFALMEAGRIDRPGWFALPDQDSAFKVLLAVGVLGLGSSALAEVQAALVAELTRLRDAPFVEALRARGAPTAGAVLHNLTPPALAIATSRVALLVGGLVVVEKVMHLNGAGAMLWQACRLRDLPLAMGLSLAAAATVCAARLLSDWARLALDPRLRGGA